MNPNNNDFENKTYYTYEQRAGNPKPLSNTKTSNYRSIVALVLSAVQIMFILFPVGFLMPPVIPIASMVFAFASKKKDPRGKMDSKAIAALVMSIISLIAFLFFWGFMLFLFLSETAYMTYDTNDTVNSVALILNKYF